MLELIVLGQVPGTRIQLSFDNVLFIWLLAVFAYFYVIYGPRLRAALETEFRFVMIYITLMLKL